LKILLTVNTVWNIVNFRLNLIRALRQAGWDVITAAPPDAYVEKLRQLDIPFYPIPIQNMGTDPLEDLKLWWDYYKLIKREKPNVVLSFTVKPNIYGGMAAKIFGIPFIPNIAGLGTAFIQANWITWVVESLYKVVLNRSTKVFFQNSEDRKLFIEHGLVTSDRTQLLPGSGVDIKVFSPCRVVQSEEFCFLLPSRLLWDKGVGEFVEAAKSIRAEFPRVRFQLLGFLGTENRSAIPKAQVIHWVDAGIVEYLGSTDDVRPYLAAADCVVLPSYREGTPKALLEAAAMARPLITTDAVGCREVVDDGVNGFLCQPRDANDLAAKMRQMIELNPQQRATMGNLGREKMVREFDEQIVIKQYLEAIKQISIG